MPAYRTVVVGTDGSSTSLAAVDRAARVARANSAAELAIVCAYTPASREETAAAEDALREEAYLVVGWTPADETLRATIGRMILRLSPVTAGRIVFDGTDVSSLRRGHLKEYYRHVQGVFQDPFSSCNPIFKADRIFTLIKHEFFPELSAAEWRGRVAASLESVSLNPADVLGKYPHQLSGGQLQRLLVARALLLEIKILVADEIISMLDASTRIDVLNLLGDLKKRGLGIIFITHDLSLGNYISDKTVILRHGAIVEMGATEKVFGDPRHPYTQGLLASVAQLHTKWGPDEPGRAAGNGRAESGKAPPLVAVADDHFAAV